MNQLIVFIKNPVAGKVKTRLAATIGDEKALRIYLRLINYTLEVCKKSDAELVIFFSDEIIDKYAFGHSFIQQGNDLGERMKHAFKTCFEQGAQKTVIVGTDCAELHPLILREAFAQLSSSDVVIGPAHDGGYYLLGMRNFFPFLFDDIAWSTREVLSQTKKLLADNHLSFTELKTLRDIDTEEDLVSLPEDF